MRRGGDYQGHLRIQWRGKNMSSNTELLNTPLGEIESQLLETLQQVRFESSGFPSGSPIASIEINYGLFRKSKDWVQLSFHNTTPFKQYEIALSNLRNQNRESQIKYPSRSPLTNLHQYICAKLLQALQESCYGSQRIEIIKQSHSRLRVTVYTTVSKQFYLPILE